jgi:DNA-binding GntR family transcriptional regulator
LLQVPSLLMLLWKRSIRSNEAFHRLMYQAANVESLWDLIRRNSGNLDRLRRLHLTLPRKALSILALFRRAVVYALG